MVNRDYQTKLMSAVKTQGGLTRALAAATWTSKHLHVGTVLGIQKTRNILDKRSALHLTQLKKLLDSIKLSIKLIGIMYHTLVQDAIVVSPVSF